MKKVLIINGHPDKESFNFGLADAYQKGALEKGNEVQVINIRDLDFNPNLQYGYRERTELEPDLIDALDKIKWAEHLVWIFPMWWFGFPAIMKGFIDRTFLPGFTFAYKEGSPFPQKLLKGRTGRIIVTADTPRWYAGLFFRNPAINQLKKGILEFTGISPVKVTYISVIKNSTNQFRKKWLNNVETLGRKE